jgi:hypothetical protein
MLQFHIVHLFLHCSSTPTLCIAPVLHVRRIFVNPTQNVPAAKWEIFTFTWKIAPYYIPFTFVVITVYIKFLRNWINFVGVQIVLTGAYIMSPSLNRSNRWATHDISYTVDSTGAFRVSGAATNNRSLCSVFWVWYVNGAQKIGYKNFWLFCSYFGLVPQRLSSQK